MYQGVYESDVEDTRDFRIEQSEPIATFLFQLWGDIVWIYVVQKAPSTAVVGRHKGPRRHAGHGVDHR